LDSKLIDTWQMEEQKAQVERGEALRIYDIQLEQGIESLLISLEWFMKAVIFCSTITGRHSTGLDFQ